MMIRFGLVSLGCFVAALFLAPSPLHAHDHSQLPVIELRNLKGQTDRVLSFGHVFKQGDVPKGRILVAHVNDVQLTLQTDPLSTWPDGSVKHAILSVQNARRYGKATTLQLSLGRDVGRSAFLKPVDILEIIQKHNYTFQILIDDETIDIVSLLKQGYENYWMHGPLAAQARVSTFLKNGTNVRVDVTAYLNGEIVTSVIVARDNIDTIGLAPIIYSYQILQNGQTVASDAALYHPHHTIWREKFSTFGHHKAYPVYDLTYFRATTLLPAFDAQQQLQETQKYYDLLVSKPDLFGPLKRGGLNYNGKKLPDRGSGGATSAYGLMSEDQLHYLVTQSWEARTGMLENSDQYGIFSNYYRSYRDRNGDGRKEPPEAYYYEDMAYNKSIRYNKDVPGTGGEINTKNVLTARNNVEGKVKTHKPAEYFIPFMVTGDRYYADGLGHEISPYSAGANPDYLTQEAGFNLRTELRGQAWQARDIYYVASLAPDGTQAKAIATKRLKAMLDHFVSFYVRKSGDVFTRIDGDVGSTRQKLKIPFEGSEVEGMVFTGNCCSLYRVYQSDWFAMVIGQIALAGYPDAKTFGQYLVNFHSGRYLQNDLSPYHDLYTMVSSEDLSALPEDLSWAGLNSYLKAPKKEKGRDFRYLWETSGSFYAFSAWAANTSLFSGVRDARAAEAILWMTQALGAEAIYKNLQGRGVTEQFGVPVTFADFSTVSLFERSLGTNNRDILTDGHTNRLIHGKGGNDIIQTRSGNHLVDGGDGNDEITAGSGEDWLFGGSGADIINGGDGINYLQGDRHDPDYGRYADIFLFEGTIGTTVIGDFTPGQDVLSFKNIPGIVSASDILDQITESHGTAILTFRKGAELRLQGVPKAALSLRDISVN